MKITCIQFNAVWHDAASNLAHLKTLFASKVSQEKPQVVVLPELFHSGFSMDTTQTAQLRSGDVFQALSALAKMHHVTLIAGVALQDDQPLGDPLDRSSPNVFNTAMVFDKDGNEQACYIKNHAFSLADEHLHYPQGHQQVLFNVGDTPCSVFICYDLRFPELFRKMAHHAEVMFVIANWPQSRQAHWRALLTARAIENQCYMVGVNRVGSDGNDLRYVGGSIVVSPMGETLCEMDERVQIQSVVIDSRKVQAVRKQFPFLQDMKPN